MHREQRNTRCHASRRRTRLFAGRLQTRRLGSLEMENRMAIVPSAELFNVASEQLFSAIRTESVREISFRVLVDIGF